MSRRNTFMHRPDELKDFGSKESRIGQLQPRFEAGALFIKKGMTDLRDQMVSFPRATHDDILDALAYVLQIAYPKKKKESTRTPYKPLYQSTGY